jgi:pilus assembly protein CpaC
MLLSRIAKLLAPKQRPMVLAAAGALMSTAGTWLIPGLAPGLAHATDLQSVEVSGAEDDGNYLRLGLAKSAVIRLPAAVKDVIVGDSAVVDVVIRNKTTAYLFGRSPAQTNVFFFDANGQEVLHLDVEVTLDGKGLKKLLDRTLPGNKIQVDTTGSNIVLRGSAANAAEAKVAVDLATKVAGGAAGAAAAGGDSPVINAMTVGEGDQVMLKVRVVEVKREIAKKLGVNLRSALTLGDVVLNAASLNPISGAAGAIGAGLRTDNLQLDAAIQALESQGVLRTLAEPTLTAISGQPAMFHAGGEFDAGSGCSAATGSSNNGNSSYSGGSCGPTFKPYGVTLAFTPKVLSEGRIELKVLTSVSELDAANSSANSRALSSRSAETTLELPSGGSMMLAGLIKDISADAVKGTPGLMKLPVLGALFRSRDYQTQQTEMVVIVTPYIVNPVGEKQLATPADRLATPNDRQSLLWGRLNKTYGTAGNHQNGVYHGTVGYIIE